MSAPTPTVRQLPAGRKLTKGYQTLITLAVDPDIAFWEEEITPPGLDGGASINTTSQHSTRWNTKAPGSLVEMTDATIKAFYDPAVMSSIVDVINVTTTITMLYPDGSTIAAYGYVKDFKPDALKRSDRPMCTITIVFTNQDPITCEEEGPVYHPGSGTAHTC